MANANTIAAGQFSQLTNPITSVNFFPTIVGGTTRLTLQAPTGIQDGQQFNVKVVMKIVGGTTTNFTPSIYFWNNANTDLTTTTGDIVLLTPSAFAVNSTTAYWATESRIWWNAGLGNFSGLVMGMQAGTLITPVALSNVPVTVTALNKIQFCCGGFFSVSNAANIVSLMDFTIDRY